MKFIFQDLNSFVDGRLAELLEDESQFRNQAAGIFEKDLVLEGENHKLELFCQRLSYLHSLEFTIQENVRCVEKLHNFWENLLQNFENVCTCTQTMDENRVQFYSMADKIFTTLLNCNEMFDSLTETITEENVEQKQQSIYLLSKIVQTNLQILESLYFHIDSLQNKINFYNNLVAHIGITPF